LTCLPLVDYLMFTSSTLPVGTPVDFLESAELHDTISLAGSFNCASPPAVDAVVLTVTGLTFQDSYCNPLSPWARTQSLVRHAV